MADYWKSWLSDLSAWLKDVKDHELKDAMEKFVESEQALKDLGQEKLNQYRDYLQRDIEYIKENDSHYDSLAWLELKESLWYELSHIEVNPARMASLKPRFSTQWCLSRGEWIAMGTLVCKNCQHSYDVYHATQITPCTECGGIYFRRKELQP